MAHCGAIKANRDQRSNLPFLERGLFNAGMGTFIRLVGLVWGLSLLAAEPFGINDLLSLRRVLDPEISPDGKWVAYAVREPRMSENRFISHIWIVPAEGGAARQITTHERGESRPKWSPDGKSIAFLSTRGGS